MYKITLSVVVHFLILPAISLNFGGKALFDTYAFDDDQRNAPAAAGFLEKPNERLLVETRLLRGFYVSFAALLPRPMPSPRWSSLPM